MALASTKQYTIEVIYALPEGQRAELIDGKLYNMAPPSTSRELLATSVVSSSQQYQFMCF